MNPHPTSGQGKSSFGRGWFSLLCFLRCLLRVDLKLHLRQEYSNGEVGGFLGLPRVPAGLISCDVLVAGVSGNSRSLSFPRMEASDSLPEFREWIFFIPFPFPNFGNGFFSFPSRSRILGMDFFHSLPFPNFGNGFFSFPSRSRTLGMDFFHSLPVPELTLSKSGIKRENGRF